MARATKKTLAEGIAVEEIAALQARVAAGQLQSEDLLRLGKLLELLLFLVQALEQPKLKRRWLRKKLFGKSEEPPPPPPSAPIAQMDTSAVKVEVTQSPEAENHPAENTETANHQNTAAEKAAPKRKGHGRRAAETLTGAEVVTCRHDKLQPGGACPLAGCGGNLYDLKQPHKFVQWVGHPALTAKRYEQQMLRCSSCQGRFAASLPPGVSPQKYDETADVALVINKYAQLTPWARQAGVQELCGLPLAEATQGERCELVANVLLPIKLEMEKQAVQAELVGADDTGVTILSHVKEQKSVPEKARRATPTTGLVAQCANNLIVLFESGAQHTGEVIGKLFKLRPAEAGLPKQLGDALASNWSHEHQVIAAKWWAHAGRSFEEL